MVETIAHRREQTLPLEHPRRAGQPLVGTPEQVVDGFSQLHDAGMEGMIMGFLDYDAEIDHFGAAVMPLMREAGFRY